MGIITTHTTTSIFMMIFHGNKEGTMNFYRSVIGSGVGKEDDYLTTVNAVACDPTGVEFFADQPGTNAIAGDGIVIGDELINCAGMFRSAYFNNNSIIKNIHVGNNVVDCTEFMRNARAVNNVGGTYYSVPFEVNITFPKNVAYLNNAFASIYGGISGNIYINNRYARTPNMWASSVNTVRSLRIFCSNVNWIMDDNPGGWSAVTNGYYRQTQNIYLYNNYTGT